MSCIILFINWTKGYKYALNTVKVPSSPRSETKAARVVVSETWKQVPITWSVTVDWTRTQYFFLNEYLPYFRNVLFSRTVTMVNRLHETAANSGFLHSHTRDHNIKSINTWHVLLRKNLKPICCPVLRSKQLLKNSLSWCFTSWTSILCKRNYFAALVMKIKTRFPKGKMVKLNQTSFRSQTVWVLLPIFYPPFHV